MPHLAVVFHFTSSNTVERIELIAERPDVSIAPFTENLNNNGACAGPRGARARANGGRVWPLCAEADSAETAVTNEKHGWISPRGWDKNLNR